MAIKFIQIRFHLVGEKELSAIELRVISPTALRMRVKTSMRL